MSTANSHDSRFTSERLDRIAVIYLRQSSERQVTQNKESQRLQYDLQRRARDLGWKRVEVIDEDLGSSASIGAKRREGFERLLASVALGEVGIIFGREVSRLSRNDKDWCRLIEVCQIFDTLIADEERIYDLASMDDQLILGIKGTLSVVELKILKTRMIAGMKSKARRGELRRLLPPGYVFGADGRVIKDPNQRVQQAMDMIFQKFRETRSVRQTHLWFRDHEIDLPVNKPSPRGMQVIFQSPKLSFVEDVLRNPTFAGAYVWGRRPLETILVGGVLKKRQGRELRCDEAQVLLKDHHEGYIDWPTFEENQRIMSGNNFKLGGGDESVGPIRSGQGLLAGLLRCGKCGRKLYVRYWGKSGTSARYLCDGDYLNGGRRCLGFGGKGVDVRFSEEVLRVVSPLGLEASFQAIERQSTRADAVREAHRRQLQQLEYEARRAFEQYDEVDPRNRLVAEELERRWNAKLEELERVKAALSSIEAEQRELSEEERARLLALGESFDRVWHSPHCPPEVRKKIVRTIVEEAIADEPSAGTLSFVVHWKGGVHTRFEMKKPPSGVGRPTADEDLEIIRKMAVRYGDDQIANVLNRLGRTTGKGKRWTAERVHTARRNHSIPGQKHATPDPDLFTMNGAARFCGVSDTTIKRLVEAGVLPREQLAPWAPWEIRRADLEAAPIRAILDRLKRTGELVIGGPSDKQRSLFE